MGHFEKAQEYIEEILRNDPLNQEDRAFYLSSFGVSGDIKRAEEEYERGRVLFGNQWVAGNVHITFLRMGADDSISRDRIVYSSSIFDAAKDYLDSPEQGLA